MFNFYPDEDTANFCKFAVEGLVSITVFHKSENFLVSPLLNLRVQKEANIFWSASKHLITPETCKVSNKYNYIEIAAYDYMCTRQRFGISFLNGFWVDDVATRLWAKALGDSVINVITVDDWTLGEWLHSEDSIVVYD